LLKTQTSAILSTSSPPFFLFLIFIGFNKNIGEEKKKKHGKIYMLIHLLMTAQQITSAPPAARCWMMAPDFWRCQDHLSKAAQHTGWHRD